MAKKVVQLYDKYKSTTKVFPKIIDECFEESAKEYIEGQVVANPEVAGTEAELGSIQIGDTKYKVGGGDKSYQHTIYLSPKTANGSFAIITIVNKENTAIDFTALATYVKNGTDNTRIAFGRADNNAGHLVYKLGYYSVNNNDYLRYYYLNTDGTGSATNPQDSSAWNVTDDFHEI